MYFGCLQSLFKMESLIEGWEIFFYHKPSIRENDQSRIFWKRFFILHISIKEL